MGVYGWLQTIPITGPRPPALQNGVLRMGQMRQKYGVHCGTHAAHAPCMRSTCAVHTWHIHRTYTVTYTVHTPYIRGTYAVHTLYTHAAACAKHTDTPADMILPNEFRFCCGACGGCQESKSVYLFLFSSSPFSFLVLSSPLSLLLFLACKAMSPIRPLKRPILCLPLTHSLLRRRGACLAPPSDVEEDNEAHYLSRNFLVGASAFAASSSRR
mmetsp:Transcript_20238/g.34142  ORF Transcript_20238/g.34142 Transcript_20238/m.34142 type:complete len:213 (-) Transcript_20238:165-803(-)